MAFLIPFSGASNSGKTTTLNKIAQKYSDNSVVILDEIIRRNNKPFDIDTIRNDPNSYLEFQYEINLQKIEEEKALLNKYKKTNDIILIDRSIIDSLFYCTFYLDKSNLSDNSLGIYVDMFEKIKAHIDSLPYFKILLFSPIKNIDFDSGLRTKKLKYFQDFEFFFIKKLTYGCFSNDLILEISTNQIPTFIDDFMTILKIE
ncbi:AAA family ATPase [Bernardetia sp. OM2101]|uniref:AAA family ATPase n=1 Tax=Bernardetia sp. OM2101 TaxID=3344876 RepID=UPI0035CFBED2